MHPTLRRLLPLLLLIPLASPAVSAAGSDEPRPGSSNEYADGDATYRVYTPRGYRPSRRVPLFVMVHGCNTSAAQQEGANRLNELADKHSFVVLYADHDTGTNTELGTHPGRCWRWYSPADWRRDGLDPATIAGQTRAVMARWRIDTQRVYVAGMSSGAMITSALGATYPDLYAAIGVVAGCEYAAGAGCFARLYAEADRTDLEAQLAHDEQGAAARLVPVMVVHGDADSTVPYENSLNVVRQWIKTGNLALSGTLTSPLSLQPASIRRTTSTRGRSSTTEDYRSPRGCLVVRRVTVHGMGHFWPGGSPDPRWYEYEDPTAPHGGELLWSFFRQFTRSSATTACSR